MRDKQKLIDSLKEERCDLELKQARLDHAIVFGTNDEISKEQLRLLYIEEDAMNTYNTILSARIDSLKDGNHRCKTLLCFV